MASRDQLGATMLEAPQKLASLETQTCLAHRDELERLIRTTMVSRGIRDPRVLDAFRCVPRHKFVPAAMEHLAYEDCPLPIGWGQTISQPYIAALMTEAAKPSDSDRCLEIGTGCGYQTAILSLLCRAIYSIEYIHELSSQAQRNLQDAGCLGESLHFRHGDGFHGWPAAAPFNLIIVTAAPPFVPKPLLTQLALGGRLVIPVGHDHTVQRLERWIRKGEGTERTDFSVEILLDVRFVPMVGEAQRQEH